MPDAPVVHEWVASYTITVVPETYPGWSDWALRVQHRGGGEWVVKRGPLVFCRAEARKRDPHGCWEIRDRGERHLAAHRFPLDEALAMARKLAPKIRLGGISGQEYMARYDQAHPREEASDA